ncbi:MAG: hypothetical protein AAGE52_04090 [Myxococcota bacterium]
MTKIILSTIAALVLSFGCRGPVTCGDPALEFNRATGLCECVEGMFNDAGTRCVLPDGGADGGPCDDGDTRTCTASEATGVCRDGSQECVSGVWGACQASNPQAEVCDGEDNDCDGVTDGASASASCAAVPSATTSACTAGSCVVTECVAGFGDCNGSYEDGCEVELANAQIDCGRCGNSCGEGTVCRDSSCVAVPVHLWSSTFSSEAADVVDVARDDENVYVAGDFIRSLTPDGGPMLSSSPSIGRDGFLVSRRADSGEFQWALHLAAPGSADIINGLAVDTDGTVVAVGEFAPDGELVGPLGTTGLESGGTTRGLIARVSSVGSVLWTETFEAVSFSDVSIGPDGNIYVVGSFSGNANLGGSVLVSRGATDVLLASFDGSGAHRWSRSYGGAGRDTGSTIHVAESVVVGARARSPELSLGGDTLSTGGDAGVLGIFDRSGLHQASALMGGGVTAITSNAGVLYVGGAFTDGATFVSATKSALDGDGYIIALDESLSEEWFVQVEGPGSASIADMVFRDGPVATGFYSPGASIGGSPLSSRGDLDMMLAVISPAGVVRWVRAFGGARQDIGSALGLHLNQVVVGGEHDGGSFGGDPLPSGPGRSGFVASYLIE